jgi:hypothetical protein
MLAYCPCCSAPLYIDVGVAMGLVVVTAAPPDTVCTETTSAAWVTDASAAALDADTESASPPDSPTKHSPRSATEEAPAEEFQLPSGTTAATPHTPPPAASPTTPPESFLSAPAAPAATSPAPAPAGGGGGVSSSSTWTGSTTPTPLVIGPVAKARPRNRYYPQQPSKRPHFECC